MGDTVTFRREDSGKEKLESSAGHEEESGERTEQG